MISHDDEQAAFRLFLETWGETSQIVIAIEELSELQKELTKFLRGIGSFENMMEEVADVEIILSQLKYLFFDLPQYRHKIDTLIEHKLQRAITKAISENGEW